MTQGEPKLTLVKINNIDVAASLLSWDQNPTLGDKVKTVAIELSRNVYSLVPELETSPTGLTVTVQRGELVNTEQWIFRGTVLKRDSLGDRIFLRCNDKLFQAVQGNITKTFNSNIDIEAGKISEIFKTLATTANLETDTSSVQDSGTILILETFICNNADIFERQQRLAEWLDWQLYYDSTDDKEHFEPKGTRAGTDTLQIGVNVLNRPRWRRDGESLVKKAKLFGGPVQTGTTNSFTATASQTVFDLSEIATDVRVTVDGVEKLGGLEGQSITADYFFDSVDRTITFVTPMTGGESVVAAVSFLSPLAIEAENPITSGAEIRIDKEDIVKVIDAENYLNTFMARYAVDFLSTTLQVTRVIDLEVGQTVTVVDNNEGINQTFIITRIRKRFPYAFDEVEVNTEPLQIEEWQISVEDRIRRIEEKLSQEETLVIHLRTGNRSVKLGRQFAKFEKRDISGDTLIYGNQTFGTWGTQKWGDTFPGTDELQQLVQGANTYIEDFLDEDFKDAGTATWTNTGSVNFTSGQIALSSTIDFNNGIITQAKLSSIEVSGDFVYELSADGGVNFEVVTPGLNHIFINTGTDLRWRATENAASTGEIGQIKITGFH